MSRTDAHTPVHHLPDVNKVESRGHTYVDMPTHWWWTEGNKHYNEKHLYIRDYLAHTPKWSRILSRAKRKRDIAREISEQLD